MIIMGILTKFKNMPYSILNDFEVMLPNSIVNDYMTMVLVLL